MPSILQTWTDERIEALQFHFAAGLSCREIANEIGVSRNAVIGKISRLNLIRDKDGMQRPRKKEASSHPSSPRPQGARRLRRGLSEVPLSGPQRSVCRGCQGGARPAECGSGHGLQKHQKTLILSPLNQPGRAPSPAALFFLRQFSGNDSRTEPFGF